MNDFEDTQKWFPKQKEPIELVNEIKFRKCLYHKDCKEGRKIFTDKEDYDAAILCGWVKAPWLANEDPQKLIQQEKERAENEAREKKLQEEYEAKSKPKSKKKKSKGD